MRPRRLNLHERDQAVNFRLVWSELSQYAAKAKRILAQGRPQPTVTGGRRVAFVENEIEDLKHRREAGGEICSSWNLEGDMRLGQGPFGADDALRDGRLRDKECARDLFGRQTPKQPKCERDARLGSQNRMTGYENEAEKIVAEVIIHRGFEIRHGYLLLECKLAAKLLMLAFEALVSAPEINGAMFRSGHEPGAWVVRYARRRPLLERGDESVLCKLLGKSDIAHDPCETCNDPGGLDPPDRVDGTMCIGSRHSYRSHHFYFGLASRGTPQWRLNLKKNVPTPARVLMAVELVEAARFLGG
jgi:hypothetical protein